MKISSTDKDDDHWEKIFKVYPLSPMFAKLKNRCCSYKQPGIDAFPNHILALNELQIDTYNFDIKMACNVCFLSLFNKN